MVFLTSLDILDTGFLTQTGRTNQLAAGDRVNAGVALRLKEVSFEIESSSNLDKSVTPANSDTGQYPWISNNPTTFSMEIVLNRKNDDTTNPWGVNDVSYIAQLYKLPHTKGFKALYYPVKTGVLADERNRDTQMIYLLGAVDTTEDQGDISISLWDGSAEETSLDLTSVKYVCVRFETCKETQLPKNKMLITLTGVITI